MSNPEKFVIVVRNLTKVGPDWYYVCGPQSPITSLSACVKHTEVLIDKDVDTALICRGREAAAYNYGLLKSLDFQPKILQKLTSYEEVDMEVFEKIVTQTKVETILHNMDKEDVEYLKNLGVLDLTIVT